MKLILRLKRRKGFTLTELIVVVAIIAILMACVAAFSQPVRSMVTGTNAKSDAVMINEIISNYLERRLAYVDEFDMYVGGNITDTDISARFDDYKKKYSQETIHYSATSNDSTITKSQPGMLVIHYNGNDKRFKALYNGMPNKASFEIYDQPLTTTSSIKLIDVDATDVDETDDMRKYKVFTDDFYAGYQFFITSDEVSVEGKEKINNLTKETFFSASIQTYKIDNSEKSLSADMIRNYYKGDSTGIDGLIEFRTGVEEVSFAMKNLVPDRNTTSWEYYDTISKANIHCEKGRTNTDPLYRLVTGTDIIIFYNTTRYTTDDVSIILPAEEEEEP